MDHVPEHGVLADLGDEIVCNCKKFKGSPTEFQAHLDVTAERKAAPEPVPHVDPKERMDTCDSCGLGVLGAVRVLMSSGSELLFCGHHATAFTATLVGMGATLVDANTGLPLLSDAGPIDRPSVYL